MEQKWKVKSKVVLVVAGALGAMTPKLAESLQQIPGKTTKVSVQKSAVFGTAKILRSTLKLPVIHTNVRIAQVLPLTLCG